MNLALRTLLIIRSSNRSNHRRVGMLTLRRDEKQVLRLERFETWAFPVEVRSANKLQQPQLRP